MMISKGYFLARRNTVRELNSFCSRVSSAMRKLYLRACDKAMLSLYLSEWMEWKCKSVTVSGFSVQGCGEFAVCSYLRV